MITILDKPEFMAVDDITVKYYPNNVVIKNCRVQDFAPMEGWIVAVASNQDYDEIEDYAIKLEKDEANGEVFVIKTLYPMEGRPLFVETYLEE